MSEQAHAAAILARLNAASGSPAMVVHDGDVPDAPDPGAYPPYVVVRFSFKPLTATEAPGATSLTFESVQWRIDVRTHSVGTDARSTRAVQGRVRGQLLNWTPTITGRSCAPVLKIDTEELDTNEQMGVKVAQVMDLYRFTSKPA